MTTLGLVLINFQNDHASGGKAALPDVDVAIKNAAEALLCFRDHQRPFIHVQTVERGDPTFPFATGTDGIRILHQTPHFENEPIIFHFSDAPFNIIKGLDPFIKNAKIDTLAICFLGNETELTEILNTLIQLPLSVILLEDACRTEGLLSTIDLGKIENMTVEKLFLRFTTTNSDPLAFTPPNNVV